MSVRMFSLQKLLGQEERIFGLLESSAQVARNSVQALVAYNQSPEKILPVDEFVRLRLVDKQITQQVDQAIYETFLTPLDREDIARLSAVLYKIPKMVDKFAARLSLSPPGVRRTDFSMQIGLLERAVDIVTQLIRYLRKEDLAWIEQLNFQLQQLESSADRQMIELYRDMFSGYRDAIEIIALKDLYEQLEKVIDRCRDAGNVVAQIALKNS